MRQAPSTDDTPLGRQVATLVSRVAGVGLALREEGGAPYQMDLVTFERLLETCAQERLLGLFRHGVRTGEFELHSAQVSRLDHLLARQLDHLQSLDRLLVETVRFLECRGVDVRVVKGRAIAELDYSIGGVRHFTDVDLLVRSRDFDMAAALLSEAGHGRRGFAERAHGFEARFGKDVSFITVRGLGIDLHRALALPPFGISVVESDLFVEAQGLEVAGAQVLTMALEQRFLHVCLHAAVGDYTPRWLPLRDVLELASSPDLDVAKTIAMARRWKVTSVVKRALTLACERIDGASIPAWAAGLADPLNSEWEQRALDLALEHSPPGIERLRATWFALDSLDDRAALIRAVVLPSRTFLSGRYQGYVDYWRHQLPRTSGLFGARHPASTSGPRKSR